MFRCFRHVITLSLTVPPRATEEKEQNMIHSTLCSTISFKNLFYTKLADQPASTLVIFVLYPSKGTESSNKCISYQMQFNPRFHSEEAFFPRFFLDFCFRKRDPEIRISSLRDMLFCEELEEQKRMVTVNG